MQKRIKVSMYDKAALARKVTKMCLDKGWEPVTKIMTEDSQMMYSTVTYFCILETKDYNPNKRWPLWER